MASEPIKDNQYRTIGYMVTESNGDQKLQDTSYRTLGYYKKSQNVTQDTSYRTIGQGNQLMRLLK